MGMTTSELFDRLSEIALLGQDWDSCDGDPPNSWSLLQADLAVTSLIEGGLDVRRVIPSVIGGIGATVVHDGIKIYLEFTNSQTIGAVVRLRDDDVEYLIFSSWQDILPLLAEKYGCTSAHRS